MIGVDALGVAAQVVNVHIGRDVCASGEDNRDPMSEVLIAVDVEASIPTVAGSPDRASVDTDGWLVVEAADN